MMHDFRKDKTLIRQKLKLFLYPFVAHTRNINKNYDACIIINKGKQG